MTHTRKLVERHNTRFMWIMICLAIVWGFGIADFSVLDEVSVTQTEE